MRHDIQVRAGALHGRLLIPGATLKEEEATPVLSTSQLRSKNL